MRMTMRLRLTAITLLGFAGLWPASPAQAVPSFSAQTGQPCATCHIGAYGPQLTPFGRAFKIGGYTQQGGEGLASRIPLSAMVLGSFTNTAKNLPAGTQPQHYGVNNNLALDQVSVFLAGRITDWAGGFVQGTWSDVDNAFHLDQVDVRPVTTTFDVGGKEIRVGITVNNNPTVQDPYNSTFAWGFPYVTSSLAPTPTALPVLAGGFANNSTGVTAYAWVDRGLYLEAGGYQSQSPWLLARLGNSYGSNGRAQGIAPYARIAYEWMWSGQDAHIGAILLQSDNNPTLSGRMTSADNGRDSFTDIAIDAGYMFLGERDTISLYGIYVHEDQKLNGTINASNAANGTSFANGYTLNHMRLTASYWFENTYGLTGAWQKTWGKANPVLFTAAPIGGSANGKPDTNAFLIEANWVPFGKQDSYASPWANLKFGVQYVLYTKFNGGSSNYDGFNRNASDNNTLYAYVWTAF